MDTQFYYDLADWMITFTMLIGFVSVTAALYATIACINRLATPKSTRTITVTYMQAGRYITEQHNL